MSTRNKATTPLFFERQGSGERIVLVHGFTQSGRSWRRLGDALAGDFEVLAVDLPGHAQSAKLRPADLGGAAQELGASCGKASYLGYSMGGRICLELALSSPQLVDRLVLVGATPGITSDEERQARRSADEVLAERLDPISQGDGVDIDEFLSEWLSNPMFSDLTIDQADLESRRTNTASGLAYALRHLGTGTQVPSHQRLSELCMPVLIVAGERDEKFTEIGKDMARRIGDNAVFALINGAAHAAPFSAPDAFQSLVSGFLASTSKH